jgi:hypothetical protein
MVANNPTVKISWPNTQFKVPNTSWVEFGIVDGTATQISTGATTNNFRHAGVVTVACYTPTGAGDLAALQLSDGVCDIFRAWQSGGITFRAPNINVVGQTQTKKFYQVNVSIPFQRDSLLSRAV